MPGSDAMKTQPETSGVVSVRTLLALLCLAGIVITGTSVAALSDRSWSAALGSTEAYGENAKAQCFAVSQESLKATASQMFSPAQASLQTQAMNFLKLAIVEAERFHGYVHEPTQKDAVHDWEWMKGSLAWMNSNILAWKNAEYIETGPPVLGPYPRPNGASPFGGLGLAVEDTDVGVVIQELTLPGNPPLRFSSTTLSHPGIYAGYGVGGVRGATHRTTGLPMLELPPPFTSNATLRAGDPRGVQASRIRPRLFPVGSGRFMMIESLGPYLGTAYIHKQQDPSDAGKVFEVLVLLPLRTVEDYLVAMSREFCDNQTLIDLHQCLSPRLYMSVKGLWIAEELKRRGDAHWQREEQTNMLVAASHGGSIRPMEIAGLPYLVATPLMDVQAFDPVIANVATHIHSLPSGYETVNGNDGFVIDDVTMNHTTNATEEYFIGVSEVSVKEGIDWWLTIASETRPILHKILDKQADLETAIAAERKRVMDDVDRNMVVMYAIMAACVVVLGLLALVAANAILQPIIDVQQAMQCVAHMELDMVTEPTSVMTEVHQMQRDFAKMVSNLIEFRAFMPVVLAGGDEQFDDESSDGFRSHHTGSVSGASDRPSEAATHSTGNSMKHKVSHKLNQMKLGHLTKHQVVVVSMSSPYFLQQGRLPQDMSSYCERMVNVVCDFAATFKGAPEFADGTNLTVTWGLMGARTGMAVKAAKLAVSVNEYLRGTEGNAALLQIGIARSSQVFGGTLGSARMRKIAGVGGLYAVAGELRYLNRMYGTHILCDHGVYEHARYECVARPMDVIRRGGGADAAAMLIASVTAVAEANREDEEWMYQIQKIKDVLGEGWARFLAEAPEACHAAVAESIEEGDAEARESESGRRLLALIGAGTDGRAYARSLMLAESEEVTITIR